MESWTDYFTSHFYAMKARPVSAFDPSGFIIVISFFLLLVGVVAATARALVSSRGLLLRSRVEKNLQDMSDYIKDRAIDHSGRQGFIAEMLSYAYLSRLAFSLSIFAIASYLNTLAAVVAGWRTPNVVILNLAKESTSLKTLPDLGHDLFKFVMTKIYGHTTYIEWFDLPDEFLAAVGGLTSFILILHPRRLLILRRFCFIFAIINLMRACCVAVTSLPDASPMCISQFDTERGDYKSLPIFPKAIFRAWKVLIRPSQHITCGDMIFSGHAVFLILCCMFARTYCVRSELNTPFTRRYPYVLWMIRYYNYILSACGIFAIVGTRLHYTLDVLIAIYITIQVWFTYHWLMNHPESSFSVINWLEHAEVHLVDHNAYRKARRSGSLSDRIEKID
ncbi:putative membrane protein [Phytophthora megakarya]|uniref:Putative membrane protein n=1 Tax=Phytophthora megakarya TaxID=4795 RepID=A0A225VSU5_9STRA|nr:putative membrane protein [Phytophthora megakarya]